MPEYTPHIELRKPSLDDTISVEDDLNSNFDKIDDAIGELQAHYVKEMTTINSWLVRRWTNGYTECFLRKNYANLAGFTKADGYSYRTTTAITTESFPVTFDVSDSYGLPAVFTTATVTSIQPTTANDAEFTAHPYSITGSGFDLYICSNRKITLTKNTTATVQVCYRVIGKEVASS